jgi:hypothetical protein
MIDMTTGKRLVIITILLLWLLLWDRQAGAQGAIRILDNQADLDYPESLEFLLSLESGSPVEEITLIYGTDQRSCQAGGSRQVVDFEQGDQISASWEWELRRSGAIAPGAQIWWQWEILDGLGNSTMSERKEMLFIDGSHRWRNLERDGVSVYWYQGDDAFASGVLDLVLEELDRLSRQIGVSPQESIDLWLYPTAADVREAIVNTSEWAGSVAFPSYGAMVVNLAPGGDAWAADVIPHELTHLVVGMAVFNCRGSGLTTWLTEGLAVYGEGEPLERLELSLEEGRLPPLRALADGFSAYSDEAGLAYIQSGQVVAYLAESYGPEQINRLLAAIQGGMTVDNALEEVFGFDTGGLDARWRTAQGYAPTPTSAAQSAQATPTPVPTIALFAPPVSATPTLTPSPQPTVVEIARLQATGTAIPTPSRAPLPEATAPLPGISTATSSPPSAPEDTRPTPSPLAWGLGILFVSSVAFGLFRFVRKGA